MAGQCTDFVKTASAHPTGPSLPYLLCTSLRVPYSVGGSEQAVERVLQQETSSQKNDNSNNKPTLFSIYPMPSVVLSTLLVSTHLIFTTILKSSIIISILCIMKLRHREVKGLAPGHTAIKQLSQDLNPDICF